MISPSDFKRGQRIELDGEPYAIVDHTTQSGPARSANTLVRAKLRNLRTGQLVDRPFKANDKVKIPDFEIRSVQYLYDDGDNRVFMDTENYDQFGLHHEQVAEEMLFLRANDEARALFFNGSCIGIELPHTVTLEVRETEPGTRGDTVTNALKAATLETGVEVSVPLFVNHGDRIVVDTRERRYVRRA